MRYTPVMSAGEGTINRAPSGWISGCLIAIDFTPNADRSQVVEYPWAIQSKRPML